MKALYRSSILPLFLFSASCQDNERSAAIPETDHRAALSDKAEDSPPLPSKPVTDDANMAAWAALQDGTLYDLQQHSAYEKPIVVLDLGHGERYGSGRTLGSLNKDNKSQNEVAVIDAVAENLIKQLKDKGYSVFTTRAPGEAFRFYNNKPDAPDLFADMRPYRMLEGKYTNRVNRSLRARIQYAYTLQHLLNSPYMVVISLHTESETAGRNTAKPKVIVQSDDFYQPDSLSLKLGEDIEKHYDFKSLGQTLWRHEDLAILSEAANIRENPQFRTRLRDRLGLPEDNPLPSAAVLFELGNYMALTKVSASSMASALTRAISSNIECQMRPQTPAPDPAPSPSTAPVS